jgi:hypothetical protein
MLVDDPELRAQMARSAARRAREFAMDAFEERLHGLVERVMALPGTVDLPPGAPPDPTPHARDQP